MEKIGLLVLLAMLTASMVETTTYKAAVVEFSPDTTTADFDSRAQNNLNGFESALQSVQDEGVQIIVFPEDAISGVQDIISEEIPVPGANPCTDGGFELRPILKRLSCLALNYQVVLIANMVDKQGSNYYNTDVVFENDGNLIAKYHKINLFGPETTMFTPGTQTNGVTFETNFGVTFGIFTCFDILFPQPSHFLLNSGIKNFVFPTAWGNKFPMYMSTAVQQGWSSKNKVNLLAANLHITVDSFYGTGSGIYSAGTARRYFMSGNSMTAATGNVLVSELTSEPADITGPTQDSTIEGMDNIQAKGTSTSEYSILTDPSGSITASTVQNGRELRCSLEYRIKSGGNSLVQERYALGANVNYNSPIGACFVVKCNSETNCGQPVFNGAEITFEYLRLNGSFPKSTQSPATFSNDFELLPAAALITSDYSGSEVVNSKIIAHALLGNVDQVPASACMHSNMSALVILLLFLACCIIS